MHIRLSLQGIQAARRPTLAAVAAAAAAAAAFIVRTPRLTPATQRTFKMSADQAEQQAVSSTDAAAAPQPPLVMQLIIDRSLLAASPASQAATDGDTHPAPPPPTPAGWGTGPLMAQAAHAAMAVTARTLASSRDTQAYVSAGNLQSMHKVVLQYPGKALKKAAASAGPSALLELSEKLSEGRRAWEEDVAMAKRTGQAETAQDEEFPEHHLWIEQPENIPTCIAIAPNRKPPALKKILNKCSLLRD